MQDTLYDHGQDLFPYPFHLSLFTQTKQKQNERRPISQGEILNCDLTEQDPASLDRNDNYDFYESAVTDFYERDACDDDNAVDGGDGVDVGVDDVSGNDLGEADKGPLDEGNRIVHIFGDKGNCRSDCAIIVPSFFLALVRTYRVSG